MTKYLVTGDGSVSEHNDVRALSVEHKIGIHGSPTCVMNFGGSNEEENKGAIGDRPRFSLNVRCAKSALGFLEYWAMRMLCLVK